MMLVMALASVLAETFLYLSTMGLPIAAEGPLSALKVIAVMIGTAALCFRMREKAKYLPLVLLVLLFVPVFHFTQIIPAGLMVLRCVSGTWNFSYDNVSTELKAGCGLFGLFMIFGGIGVGMEFIDLALPWFVLFLMTEVFQLRVLRDERLESLDTKYVLYNAAVCLIMGLTVAVLILPGMQKVYAGVITAVYRWTVYPLLHGFGRIIYWILYACAAVIRWFAQFFHFEFEPEIPDMEIGSPGEGMSFNDGTEGMDARHLLWQLAALILLAVLVFWFIRIIRRAMRRRQGVMPAVIRTPFTESGRKTHRQKSSSAVRESYRKYLRACAKKNIPAEGASDLVAAQTDQLLNDSSGTQLRQMYLPVCYGGQPDTQADEVKQLVRSIRNRFRSGS